MHPFFTTVTVFGPIYYYGPPVIVYLIPNFSVSHSSFLVMPGGGGVRMLMVVVAVRVSVTAVLFFAALSREPCDGPCRERSSPASWETHAYIRLLGEVIVY